MIFYDLSASTVAPLLVSLVPLLLLAIFVRTPNSFFPMLCSNSNLCLSIFKRCLLIPSVSFWMLINRCSRPLKPTVRNKIKCCVEVQRKPLPTYREFRSECLDYERMTCSAAHCQRFHFVELNSRSLVIYSPFYCYPQFL